MDAKARQDCIKEIDLLKVSNNTFRYYSSWFFYQTEMSSGCFLFAATKPSECHQVLGVVHRRKRTQHRPWTCRRGWPFSNDQSYWRVVVELINNWINWVNIYFSTLLFRFLQHFRRQQRLIPERTIWKYFIQICSALEHMHSRRIMHRGSLLPNHPLLPIIHPQHHVIFPHRHQAGQRVHHGSRRREARWSWVGSILQQQDNCSTLARYGNLTLSLLCSHLFSPPRLLQWALRITCLPSEFTRTATTLNQTSGLLDVFCMR